jgi:RNA polymerase sigma-70 factor, ECF subfamily
MTSAYEHRPLLWGIAYRMTGSAADADDIVQETFARALEHAPTGSLKAWLAKVATNLARDLLRRRKRRAYDGPWLPEAIDTDQEPAEVALRAADTPGARYELLESVGYAFLLALEALTPSQRAVLVLRDVFDWSVDETAAALGMSAANVKTTHHRARRAMRDYDAAPARPTPELTEKNRAALAELFQALASSDHVTLERIVAEEVRALSDGAGEFFAAHKPILGRDRVTRFFIGLVQKRGMPSRLEVRTINGLPALYGESAVHEPRDAPRWITRVDLRPDGRVIAVHSVLATPKLRRIGIATTP